MTSLNVTSEVGRLRSVLLHAPGAEVDLMLPSMMEELLFDDILFGDAARQEHARLADLMRLLGIEVLDVRDLLQETLLDEDARRWILGPLLEVTPTPIANSIRKADAAQLTAILIEGVRIDPKHPSIVMDELFEIPPLPNLCFQRDPQIILKDRVIISSMATTARWRESFLASAIFRFHPKLKSHDVMLDNLDPDRHRPLHLGSRRPHFEGGDFLVLSPEVVALGHSERTNRTGVHHLARTLAKMEGGPRWLIIVTLPNKRAYMHLDTVMTPVDRDACLVHRPIIDSSRGAQIFEIDLHNRDLTPSIRPDLLGTLRKHGVDLKPILCGGQDPMSQHREQWTDGANAMALAPGVITLYDRNVATARQLDREGFRIVSVDEFAKRIRSGEEAFSLDDAKPTCILVPSNEISRARGGPHCLSHPLLRDD